METPTLGDALFVHPHDAYLNFEPYWNNDRVDEYISLISNKQLKHRINEHELLVIATTPDEHRDAAVGVAQNKVRQTFRKALEKHFKEHNLSLVILTEQGAWDIWNTMRRILDNRVKRLKARWAKAKRRPWATQEERMKHLESAEHTLSSHPNGPGRCEVA